MHHQQFTVIYLICQIIDSLVGQWEGAVEYSDSLSAEGQDFPNECSVYDTKQSDGEAPGMLKLYGIQNNISLPLFPGPLLPGMVAPKRVLCMDQIQLFDI